MASFYRAREKETKTCLEGLKCFNKELLVVLSNEFKLLKSCFYEKHVIIVL